ncbi:MAG: IS91 family transposase [Gemmataceae bacterium]|nr:IS91 family transposase [Gemmataceae bacterium]
MADILRAYTPAFLEAYGHTVSPEQGRVLRDLARCRTAALGGHLEQCDHCGHQRPAYNSCRNRHCPKCQAATRARWLDERAAELLPTHYFHVVFTLPDELGPLALQNPRVLYGLLFRAASETLLEIAADPQHLGAQIGFVAVLHTWGQNLHLHPHVHCIVPGGGLSPDGSRWVACRPRFFLPVRVLSHRFRHKFVSLLRGAYAREELVFHGQQQPLATPARFEQLLGVLRRKKWVVYAKPPHGSPEQVLKYLARYTHRVAISNQRLLKMEEGKVFFRWKDYAHGGEPKTMALDAVEFIRRFLLHVVPSGFVRIRHYGFLAHRHRAEKLAQCRRLLGAKSSAAGPTLEPAEPIPAELQETRERCPVCQQGRMVVVAELASQPWGIEDDGSRPCAADTS